MVTQSFQRPMTAQEAVLKEIRRNILTGAWEPGAPIRQDAVATELGVSRVPVREALRILEGEGQISYVPHKGYIVRRLDADELVEVYRLRELLEAEAIRHAVPKLTDSQLAAMHDAMVAMEALEPGELEPLSEHNRAFHRTLFDAAGTPRLQHFIRLLRDLADVYRVLLYSDTHTLEKTCEEHRAIYAACLERDVEAVIALHDRHRSHTVELLLPRLLEAADGAS
jgi:DNA-binding GntR family transcriptional regulator